MSKASEPIAFSKVNVTTPVTKEYRIHGSAMPTEDNPRPQIFVSTIFAKNHVFAKAKFFKILEKKYKIKATKGLIINCERIPEPSFKEVQNYGVRFIYRSRSGVHNAYKECRAISRCGAVDHILRELAGRHKLKRSAVDIISVETIPFESLRRAKTMEFADENVEFPVFTKILNTRSLLIPAEYNPSE
ncbi:60S ribosomal protein L18 [Encephalitozoon hellem ATCC 50504]|uniref:60S ribosomal protein L20 n=1 Tax=Encephalitozoon hellem TaxID=27973 RepID=A0A9Q9FBZ3_ENCHE|nr:60S ribosomal protein L18 [Encephalitozoon hellem ATCC 50504]AFM98758.1 60S ribosomal protein L18 [Encephalitozoon hellem ATCC 50504]UTX43735.1 ribosomal protein L20 [Encephalitozoon hellem]WEL39212.1 ribosomal protein L18A [Encephalitozoon hellem]|eukprot:XP_003887739.1 60S ribosomal protein L18 [Encephalitozoon hellem ATCC 50504]